MTDEENGSDQEDEVYDYLQWQQLRQGCAGQGCGCAVFLIALLAAYFI
ncbi:MAG: hypothetical protein WCK47_07440 [bacterium]|nr:hypothetical protein [Candidatus Sumerlaeota bacterium]